MLSQPPTRVGACLTPDTLAEFRSGRLGAAEAAAVAEHIASCPRCRLDAGDHASPATVDLVPRPSTSVAVGTADLADPPPEAELPEALYGGYALREELGRGGMGVVFRARHVFLNRPAALKLLRYGSLSGPDARARFLTEGEAVAKLDHPHIVRIYDYGEQDGEPYFAMELIDGGSLAGRLRAGPLPPDRAAEVVEQLARAVEYAHGRGVIHRDLKPANVLLTADGVPKVADFGLALLAGSGFAALPGEKVGTPAYMAPEQVRGEPAGPATDVYGLGAILYECLAGRPPFQGSGRIETYDRVLSDEPAWPRALDRRVPADLDAAVRRCLAKDPTKRYPTAAALADALAHYRRRWRRRLVLAGLVAAGAGGAAAYGLWPDPDRPRKKIEAALARGREVVLLGESGGPAYARMVVGADNSQSAVGRDGAFRVTAWDLALLELVADPQADWYRFTAEVCHERAAANCAAGLFVRRKSVRHGEEAVHSFWEFTFNDVDDLSDPGLKPEVLAKLPPGAVVKAAGNPARLNPRMYIPRGFRTSPNHGGVPASVHFKPKGMGNRDYRTLVIEVRGGRIEAWFDGAAIRGLQVADYDPEFRTEKLHRSFPKDLPNGERFPARGGLGLYARNATVSFRRASVQPLGAAQGGAD